ncbi:hypothetical protein M441DRAFT_368901, partial [Trichoderma asperellum CBS 433.97]
RTLLYQYPFFFSPLLFFFLFFFFFRIVVVLPRLLCLSRLITDVQGIRMGVDIAKALRETTNTLG